MTYLKEKQQHIEEILTKYLPSDRGLFSLICESMNYSVLNGGKRLRPVMLLEAFGLFCDNETIRTALAEPFAAAIEFIHSYSLVHDDLPAMDNDMYRRGQLTTHARFGHAMGVLAGDALLNYAFELMSRTISEASLQSPLLASRAASAMSIISSKVGYSGMIGGQVLDIDGVLPEGKTEAELICEIIKIYELKTSRLFEAAICAGAALSGAADEQISTLEDMAYNIGVAFQIHDDILDVTSTVEKLGKDVGNDQKNNKLTICSLIGLERAKKLCEEYNNNALKALERISTDNLFFRELIEYLGTRDM